MIGLSAAIDYSLSLGIEPIWERILTLSKALREHLSEIRGVTVCDLGLKKCGIVSFIKEGFEATDIKHRLNQKGINVSVSTAEYSRLDMQKRNLSSLVRASVHYYNIEEEIARFCHEVSVL